MSKATEWLGFLARAVIAGLAIAFVIVYLWPSLADRIAGEESAPSPAPTPASYADAVNRTAPAVVLRRARR